MSLLSNDNLRLACSPDITRCNKRTFVLYEKFHTLFFFSLFVIRIFHVFEKYMKYPILGNLVNSQEFQKQDPAG